MIYHLLAESEPFSDIKGGAVSRWVANVNRTCGGSVVCCCADETWGFDSERIAILPKVHLLRRVRAKAHRLPIWLQKLIIFQILKPLARTIHAGDIVWVHNRPEYASILSRFLAKRRIQVVLHMHNSHLKALDNRAWPLDSVTPVYCSHFLAGEASRCGVSMKAGFVLHNGVDPHLFHPAPMSDCERVEIAFAGRLVPEKGVHILAMIKYLFPLAPKDPTS